MDATIDMKSLEEAVTVFYRSAAQQQSNAHDWLTKAQMSPQAWSFVWDLMQLGKVKNTVCFRHFCFSALSTTDLTKI